MTRLDDIAELLAEASPDFAAKVAILAIERIGELGREAGEAFKLAQDGADPINFEEGMAQIGADGE